MKKHKLSIIIFIILIAIVLYFIISNNIKTNNAMSTIGNSATDYIKGIDNAKSHLNEFSYNSQTGKVEYSQKNSNVQNSTASNELTEIPVMKTITILEENGYTFFSIPSPEGKLNYTYFTNGTITVTALIEIENKSYLAEFRDKSIGETPCGITDTSVNINEEKLKQYDAYLKWKNTIGLTEEQINKALIVYYLANVDKK